MAKEDKKAKKAAKKEAKAAKKANKVSDPEFNKVLFKSIISVLCVMAICITATANIGKLADAKISAAEAACKTAEGTGSVDASTGSEDSNGAYEAADPSIEDGTEAPDGETADGEQSEAPDGETATQAADGSASDGSSQNGSKAPQTTADVLKYYNAATAKAVNKKVPFSKERDTVEKSYQAGAALKAMNDIVYKFMGIGEKNKFTKDITEEQKDVYYKYLQASTLKESDVKSAVCTESNGKYTIVIKVKDGSSSVSGGAVVSSNNSPLDRSGLACGDKDKDYWDHKTAENVMSGIAEVPGCGKANINESYSNATITAVVDAATGNLVSLTAKFDFRFELSKVLNSTGVAEASSTVYMKNFKW